MKRAFFSLLSAFAVSGLSLVAAAQEVNVYSHRHYEADQVLLDQFTKQTGIKVNIIKAKADELIERIKAEGSQSPADLLITADAGRLFRAKKMGLLQPVKSDILDKQVPANLRDDDREWYGFTVRARVLVYAKDRVKPSELSTYEALADKSWKGRLLARSSSNIYNQSLLASIVAANGQKEAIKWAMAVRKNMARAPRGSDRDQMRGVAAGLADVAIVNTYYLGLLANSADKSDREVAAKLGVFFPNQKGRGAHINVSGGGVTKHAPNKANAIKLLEFLTSAAAQKSFASSVYEYPLSLDTSVSPLLKSWGKFKADSLSLSKLGENNSAAVKAFAFAKWK